jgi:tRNA A37 threonylcarbamoyladenosine synthetase subunit TsaC/SUA5/YrdC
MQHFDLRALDPNSPDGVVRLNEVLEAVIEGGLVTFSTSRGWRLGTCSQDPARSARIRELTGLSPDRPLTYLIPSLGILEAVFEEEVPRGLEELGAEVWPGTTTIVVDAEASILPQARGDASGIGLRLPDAPLLRRLMAGLPPLAQAGLPGDGTPALEALADHVDVRLDLPRAPQADPGRVLYLRADGSTEVLRS